MSEDVILLAGLPGCGKTTHLCQMCQEGWLVFDDYKAEAIDRCSAFRMSRKFASLISAIRNGLKCAVADIDFCKTESRGEAESVLLEQVPGINLGWYFFENNPSACKANIRRRNRDRLQNDLEKLHEYCGFYRIPPGAHVLPVWPKSKI